MTLLSHPVSLVMQSCAAASAAQWRCFRSSSPAVLRNWDAQRSDAPQGPQGSDARFPQKGALWSSLLGCRSGGSLDVGLGGGWGDDGLAPRAVRCQWRCALRSAGSHADDAEEPPPDSKNRFSISLRGRICQLCIVEHQSSNAGSNFESYDIKHNKLLRRTDLLESDINDLLY